MKSQLIAIVAAVLVVGCGPSVDIHDAAAEGNIEAVKQHLAAGADVNAKSNLGETPLHFAATKEMVELLIAKGADVNAKGHGGWIPLHRAIYGRQNEIVELLIAEGADVNAKDDNSDTPLDEAIIYKSPEIADLLRKHGGKHGTIHMAAKAGDAEAVKEFLAAGTDVKRDDPFTPLIAAATDGHMEVIELLIANGADVNAKANDQLGGTALHMTANLGHKKIVELLVAAGADVNAKMLHGMTPLHFAANNKGIAKFLIDKGADVNAKLNDGPHNGSTPLDFANVPNLGDPETADLIRKHGGKTGAELKAEGK